MGIELHEEDYTEQRKKKQFEATVAKLKQELEETKKILRNKVPWKFHDTRTGKYKT